MTRNEEQPEPLIDLGPATAETKGYPIMGEPDSAQGARVLGIAED